MRIVVVGASGNIGTSVLRSLLAEERVDSILGVSRRPAYGYGGEQVEWARADIVRDDLVPLLRGADVVVLLAWLIQPGRDESVTRAVNVDGSQRVMDAVAEAGVGALVYSSSIGAYSRGPKDRPVDESWETGGTPSSFYARHKAEVESRLDAFEAANPAVRVVRLRPGLVFKRGAASAVRRLFAGPFLPGRVAHPRLIPVLPLPERMVFQAVHSHDVGDAFALAALGDASGAFNLAADPVLDHEALGRAFQARVVRVPEGLLRGAAAATFKARLQPSEPGWVDMALNVPVMDTTRARTVLGWTPEHDSIQTLLELLAGMREGTGLETPTLDAKAGGTARVKEIASGVGARDGRQLDA